jgi:acetate kinase
MMLLAGLSWAGFTLDEAANRAGGPRISTGSGPTAWVIPTNEELVIARQTRGVLGAMQAELAS